MKIKQTIRQYIAVFIYISVISTIFAAALISMSRINNIQEIIQKSFKSSNHAKEFIEFFKNTANFNISYLFYENGAIKLELFEMSLGINERMKFFDFYNDYLSTLENKTPEMNKFIEKFLEAKNNNRHVLLNPDVNSVFGIIGITLAVISGLSIIAIIVALIKPKERENNLSSSARVIIPRDNVESIIDLNTCRINLNTCRINLRAQIYKNDSNNLPPNYQNEWREEYDKNQQPPNYQSLPPQYTKEDESRYKKAQEANRPSNSVRIDEGFFSRLRNSKICAVLLIDNDAREERNHNGQNWFQQLFNIKPVQAKTR